MLTGLLILLVLLCLAAEAFFSGSETAVISADKAQLRAAARRGDRRARLAQRLLERTEALLSTTLVGTNLAVVTATSLATLVVARLTADGGWAIDEGTLNTLVMSPLILIFGEIVPKSIARASADTLTLRIAWPLRLCQRVFRPAVVVIARLTEAVLALFGGHPTDDNPYVTREELMALADLAEEHGLFVSGERRMIRSILELRDRPVSSVMVPLVDMVSLPLTATVGSLIEAASRSGYSRYPVYERRVDNVVGVVSVVDVLRAGLPEPDADAPVAPHVQRDVTYVPETKSTGELLRELRYSRVPMAVCVDERGGVVGLATAEDLAEEIVGRIRDARRDRPDELVARGRREFECDARLDVDELAERTGVPIPKEGFETVGGLVLKLTGGIPQAGEVVEQGPLRIEVLQAGPRRVERLRVTRREGL
jgi:CBS domain containing-hemolysin-like protein